MACWLLIQPLTLYEDVYSINPGHYLEYDGTLATERQWYRPAIECADYSYPQIRERFMSLYRQAISLRLRSDVRDWHLTQWRTRFLFNGIFGTGGFAEEFRCVYSGNHWQGNVGRRNRHG